MRRDLRLLTAPATESVGFGRYYAANLLDNATERWSALKDGTPAANGGRPK